MDGGRVNVFSEHTEYVISGRVYKVESSFGSWSMWVGLNGPRIFYIAYIGCGAREARETFAFCFGGAEKVGWEFNYEPAADLNGNFVSIWGSCMADMDRPMVVVDHDSPIRPYLNASAESPSTLVSANANRRPAVVTPYGEFWITDIALMVQSYIRTCERHGFKPPLNREPAPL
jgi:hypothetical protein